MRVCVYESNVSLSDTRYSMLSLPDKDRRRRLARDKIAARSGVCRHLFSVIAGYLYTCSYVHIDVAVVVAAA